MSGLTKTERDYTIMKNTGLYITLFALAALLVFAHPAQAALGLDGQSGVFLNSLAYPLAPDTLEVSAHNVDLDNLGDISSVTIASGFKGNLEMGYTRITSSVSGVADQSNIFGKWQFIKETDSTPAVALTVINRSLTGGESSLDYGLSATKIVKMGSLPTVLDIGARSTRSLGLGLFGFSDNREIKLEGSVAVFVTKNFAVGAEFKQQIGAETWKDIAFRYVPTKNLNIDFGIADLGPGLNSQIALAVTYTK